MKIKLHLLTTSFTLIVLLELCPVQVQSLGLEFDSVATHQFNGEIYSFVEEPILNFTQAIRACTTKGLVLASARTKEEMNFYESLKEDQAFARQPVSLYGSRDNQNKFWWREDQTSVGDFWNPEEPNEPPGNEPICIYLSNGTTFGLIDGPCSIPTGFICRSEIQHLHIHPTRKPTLSKRTTRRNSNTLTLTSTTTTTTTTTPKPTEPTPPDSNPDSGTKKSLELNDRHFCDGKKCGQYPDPNNCAGHYECGEDTTITRHKLCPSGLQFRIETSMCEASEFVDCKDRPMRPPISCKGKPCGLYPDENDCAAYYFCGLDKTVVEHKICQNGLLFHKISQVCDLPENVKC